MKICELIASNGNGGLENHFIDLANGLAAHDHDIHVIIPNTLSGTFTSNVTVHRLPLENNRRNPLLLWQLYKLILSIKPDIIHCHASKSTALLASIKRFISTPCVATAHNIKSKLSFYRKMDAVIGVSGGVASSIQHPVTEVIYNGLNIVPSDSTRASIATRYNIPNDRPIVLSIARLVDAKDFSMLIAAWQNIDAALLIVGDGPLKQVLAEQIKHLHLESKVHLLGYIPNASELIPSADLVVISSKREGFNYVMAEALLQSKPVISTNVPAPNEILPKKYLSPVGDISAMHNLLMKCLDDLEKVNQDYLTVYNWAQDHFTLESMVASTEKFLHRIVSKYKINHADINK